MRDTEYLEFCVATAIAEHKLRELSIHLKNNEDFKQELKKAGLTDAAVLFKMMEKVIREHNFNIERKVTKLKKLSYRQVNWRVSNILREVQMPWRIIEKVIKENPEENNWSELYKMIMY